MSKIKAPKAPKAPKVPKQSKFEEQREKYLEQVKDAVPFEPTAWTLMGLKPENLVVLSKEQEIYKFEIDEDTEYNPTYSFMQGTWFEQEEDDIQYDNNGGYKVIYKPPAKFCQITGKPLKVVKALGVCISRRHKVSDTAKTKRLKKGHIEVNLDGNFLTTYNEKVKETHKKLEGKEYRNTTTRYIILYDIDSGEIEDKLPINGALAYTTRLPKDFQLGLKN